MCQANPALAATESAPAVAALPLLQASPACRSRRNSHNPLSLHGRGVSRRRLTGDGDHRALAEVATSTSARPGGTHGHRSNGRPDARGDSFVVAVSGPVRLALEGATLRQDLDDNATLYDTKLENRDIVTHGRPAPRSAAALIALLNKYSRQEGFRSGTEQQ